MTKESNMTHGCGVTPNHISRLRLNEIFVFGSNLRGMHCGGAARAAVQNFGAVMGQGVGLQGQSYAIPTMQGGVETIKPYVDEFIEFAKAHPWLHFLVTRIGCGIAGFKDADIAPLFSAAVTMANISLPAQFIEVILSPPQLPEHTRRVIYGQTRTLVDILCAMNEQDHFNTPKQAMNAITGFMNTLRNHGDEVAWNCSVRSINAFAYECFGRDGLDIDKLQSMLEKDWYKDGISRAYMHYVVEKSIKLVEMLNEFRRYTDPEQLKEDFIRATGGVNHCGPQPRDYYFAFGSPSGFPYIQWFLERYITSFWSEIAPTGVLDNARFKDFMYQRHARGIAKYGMEAVIRRNFKPDSPCHPEVYCPYRGGSAPIYVDTRYCDAPKVRRSFAKSCGEGKGPNGIPDYFEFNRIKRLIAEDEKYAVKANSYEDLFYYPKEDITLPIFDCRFGKMHFLNLADKKDFLDFLHEDNGNR